MYVMLCYVMLCYVMLCYVNRLNRNLNKLCLEIFDRTCLCLSSELLWQRYKQNKYHSVTPQCYQHSCKQVIW